MLHNYSPFLWVQNFGCSELSPTWNQSDLESKKSCTECIYPWSLPTKTYRCFIEDVFWTGVNFVHLHSLFACLHPVVEGAETYGFSALRCLHAPGQRGKETSGWSRTWDQWQGDVFNVLGLFRKFLKVATLIRAWRQGELSSRAQFFETNKWLRHVGAPDEEMCFIQTSYIRYYARGWYMWGTFPCLLTFCEPDWIQMYATPRPGTIEIYCARWKPVLSYSNTVYVFFVGDTLMCQHSQGCSPKFCFCEVFGHGKWSLAINPWDPAARPTFAWGKQTDAGFTFLHSLVRLQAWFCVTQAAKMFLGRN